MKIESNKLPNILEVRCEIYIGKKDFLKIKDQFANPRNAAGGSLRQNPKDTKKSLKYFAYGFGAMEPTNFLKQSEFLDRIKDWGFSINPLVEIIKGMKQVEKQHK